MNNRDEVFRLIVAWLAGLSGCFLFVCAAAWFWVLR